MASPLQPFFVVVEYMMEHRRACSAKQGLEMKHTLDGTCDDRCKMASTTEVTIDSVP